MPGMILHLSLLLFHLHTRRLQELSERQSSFHPRVSHLTHPLGSTFRHLPILQHKFSWQIFPVYGLSTHYRCFVPSKLGLLKVYLHPRGTVISSRKKCQAFKSCCQMGYLLVIVTGSVEFRNWDQILKREQCPLCPSVSPLHAWAWGAPWEQSRRQAQHLWHFLVVAPSSLFVFGWFLSIMSLPN